MFITAELLSPYFGSIREKCLYSVCFLESIVWHLPCLLIKGTSLWDSYGGSLPSSRIRSAQVEP